MYQETLSTLYTPSPENITGTLEMGIATLPSEAHPEDNEDANFTDHLNNSAGLFDGKSGSGRGQAAALFARDFIHERLADIHGVSLSDIPLVHQAFRGIITDAGEALRRKDLGGDTTATFLNAIGHEVVYGHIGDSRLYRFNGNLTQLTQDHGVLMSLKPSLARAISKKLDRVRIQDDLDIELTIPIEAYEDTNITYYRHENDGGSFYHPVRTSELDLFIKRNAVYGLLGNNRHNGQVNSITLNDSDLLLLTSDGIHDNLTSEQIAQILRIHKDNPNAAAKALASEAYRWSNIARFTDERGEEKVNIRAKSDDMTAIVVWFREGRFTGMNSLNSAHIL